MCARFLTKITLFKILQGVFVLAKTKPILPSRISHKTHTGTSQNLFFNSHVPSAPGMTAAPLALPYLFYKVL
jgi:hypothetical protein